MSNKNNPPTHKTTKLTPPTTLDCSTMDQLQDVHLAMMLTSKMATNLEELSIRSSALTDHSIPYITRLKKLRSIELRSCIGISTAALKELSRLSALETLSLINCHLTPELIDHLSNQLNLQSLRLSSFCDRLDADGTFGDWLQYVIRMKHLRELRLDNIRLSGVNLMHLQHLPQLQYLRLSSRTRWDRCTAIEDRSVGDLDKAVQQLQAANPLLKVEWGIPTSTTDQYGS